MTIIHVEANRVTGTREPIVFRVAWPEGPHFQRVVSARQPLPQGYVPVEGAHGEVGACGEDPDRYAALAVVFPSTRNHPFTVEDLTVTYEVDGDEHTTMTEVALTQCPEGSHPTAASSRWIK